MAKRINLKYGEDMIQSCTDEVAITNFSIFGYKKYKNNVIEFIYLFQDDKDKIYLIKNPFFVEDEEKEKKYFESPIHIQQNLNLDIAMNDNNLRKMINDNFARFKDNTYYTDFRSNDVLFDKEYISIYGCKDYGTSTESLINFKIPFNIYFKIASIMNNIMMKLPIYATIEEDTRWDNYNLYDRCKLNYLGACATNDNHLISYYSLNSNNNLIGFAQLNENIRGGIINKIMSNEQFISLFGKDGFFLSDPTKTIILDWKVKDEIKSRVAVVKPTKNNKRMNIYVIDQELTDSSILNPYKDIFSNK